MTDPSNITWSRGRVSRDDHEKHNGHPALVVWFTGLSAAGKSTLATAVEWQLFERDIHVARLDGDNLRHGLNSDLGFSHDDRTENIRRVAEVAALLHNLGNVVLAAFISPYAVDRAFARSLVPEGRFLEVYVKCDLAECERRDPKGLYQKAHAGQIAGFTGVDDVYEEPEDPELVVDTAALSEIEAVSRILEAIERRIALSD
jgi:adenylyl-sulfate kinase